MAFSVPDLSYAFDALEPHIDARTMEIHHDKHHAAYVTNLNAALESRSVIGAAVGIAMHRENISMAIAFDKLVELSQTENMKLRDLAKRITEVYEADLETDDGPR